MTTESEFRNTFKPRWQYFRCPKCHRIFVTVAVQRGDVPITLGCNRVPGGNGACDGTMRVNVEFRVQDWPLTALREADAEWYRPTSKDELRKMKKKAPKLHDYLMKGGLMLRSPSGLFTSPLDATPEGFDGAKDSTGPTDSNGIATTAAQEGRCPFDGNALDANGECAIHGRPDEAE